MVITEESKYWEGWLTGLAQIMAQNWNPQGFRSLDDQTVKGKEVLVTMQISNTHTESKT